ncbi:MAG: phage head-tail joining protein, partial [Geminicoccaceae bacterium]
EQLEAMREALLATRYRGVRTVEYGEKRVTYAGDAEMAAALADLDRRLAVLASGRRRRLVLTSAAKGL